MKKKHTNRPRLALGVLAVLALGLALSSCIEGDTPITVDTEGGALFDRYVALGNSITAGYQSDGIHVEFQEEAYPVLLAEKAEASFGVPALALPGCRPPLVGPLTTVRTNTTVDCAGRLSPPPFIVQNLAVPGADVTDVTAPAGTGTVLNTMILGGRTQVQAMIDADPSLVSVWIGNNDALSAALSGETAALTPLTTFTAEYDEIVAALLDTDAEDAILIGVANAAQVAPALQPGAYFWAVANAPTPPPVPLEVNENCAPFTLTGPNTSAFVNLFSIVGISTQLAADPDGPVVINCADDAPFILNAAEQAAVATRIAEFNAYIQAEATDNGWIYVDPTTSLIGPALADPDQIRKCQGFATVTDAASFQAAVENTCPGPSAPDGSFFGTFFSFDGVHPSGAAHAVIADTLAARLNAKHGLSLPVN